MKHVNSLRGQKGVSESVARTTTTVIRKVMVRPTEHRRSFKPRSCGKWAGIAQSEEWLYGLDGPEIEYRWGEIFHPLPEGSWGPPSLLYKGYRVSFQGVKRPGRGVNRTPPSSAEVKDRVELFIYCFLFTFMACSMVKSTLSSAKNRFIYVAQPITTDTTATSLPALRHAVPR